MARTCPSGQRYNSYYGVCENTSGYIRGFNTRRRGGPIRRRRRRARGGQIYTHYPYPTRPNAIGIPKGGGGRRQQAQHRKRIPPIVGCSSINMSCDPYNPYSPGGGGSCCPGLTCISNANWQPPGSSPPGSGFTCQDLGDYWDGPGGDNCLPPGANCTHSPACCSGQCYSGGGNQWGNPGSGGYCL